jgi:DNA-binding protein H-NS
MMESSVLPTFPSFVTSESSSTWASVEEIQEALHLVHRQKLQLEQRERQLLHALALFTRGRLREMVDTSGVAAPAFERLMRRAVDSGQTDRQVGSGFSGATRTAERARKAPLRFRHPDEPGLVWSGRGKTPQWIRALEMQGRLEQARIPPEEN